MYFYGENSQDLRAMFLPSESNSLQSCRRRYIAFVSANLPNNPSSPFVVCTFESPINLMRMTPSFPQEQIQYFPWGILFETLPPTLWCPNATECTIKITFGLVGYKKKRDYFNCLGELLHSFLIRTSN